MSLLEWLFGNSARVDRILENASKPMWVIPRWAMEDAGAMADKGELARLRRANAQAVAALTAITQHGDNDCDEDHLIAARALAAMHAAASGDADKERGDTDEETGQ